MSVQIWSTFFITFADDVKDIIINTNLLDDSSYLEIIYFNQQLMRDKKIEEILK